MRVRSSSPARFVLIGEIHDNADHHRLQAWLVSRLAEAGRPALVMEMTDTGQADALDAYLAGPDADAAGLSILPGNPDRETTRRIGRESIDAIAPEARGRLQLDAPLPSALERALLGHLYLSHCELMPQDALVPMVNVQRHRDAVQADAVLAAGGKAILMAGNGHVRADRGVPWYLARRAPEATIATVMLGRDSRRRGGARRSRRDRSRRRPGSGFLLVHTGCRARRPVRGPARALWREGLKNAARYFRRDRCESPSMPKACDAI